jgi:hypothetical protein
MKQFAKSGKDVTNCPFNKKDKSPLFVQHHVLILSPLSTLFPRHLPFSLDKQTEIQDIYTVKSTHRPGLEESSQLTALLKTNRKD